MISSSASHNLKFKIHTADYCLERVHPVALEGSEFEEIVKPSTKWVQKTGDGYLYTMAQASYFAASIIVSGSRSFELLFSPGLEHATVSL